MTAALLELSGLLMAGCGVWMAGVGVGADYAPWLNRVSVSAIGSLLACNGLQLIRAARQERDK